ncbi:MAG: L-histidine N(alpha)-methyltransferase [Bacteroidetes bacterium]|nr:L-histidine N(alpha)-methyltransferase [Bacteroidota bacterium]MBU1578117.1 L-histidine N(alpha)-methyltransferase [Bacteroidota bacterium]MBU2613866.1 L-histidine N(alpha)-methyltransferase [Patescibacteria group bacterium]
MDTIQEKKLSSFAIDVMDGLRADPKYLSSKYFYDEAGSRLFQQIMHMPEYYLTDCEMDIFKEKGDAIIQAFGMNGQAFDLIELGAGDGLKTKVLLEKLCQLKKDFTYIPVDISATALNDLEKSIRRILPEIKMSGLKGDYFEMLSHWQHQKPKVLLFLGSNLGNFSMEQTRNFLSELRKVLNAGDQLLLGLDLQKDPEVILQAYNDPHGLTAQFNLNLLTRINKEMDADFRLELFEHQEVYNPDNGLASSYLISKEEQKVTLKLTDETIRLTAGERIFTEQSQKYSKTMIEEMAQQSGFEIVSWFSDQRNWFTDVLWRVPDNSAKH